MTTALLHSPPAPHLHYSPTTDTHQCYMQNHPPLRTRLSATAVARQPPMPPSLFDSPFIQSPNSPFRRDHAVHPSAPAYSTGHDRLNLQDTVPIGVNPQAYIPASSRAVAEPAPDDIGVAGAPKSARSSSILVRSAPLRPQMTRGNSWILQQQQMQLQQQQNEWRQQQQQPSQTSGQSRPKSSSTTLPPSSFNIPTVTRSPILPLSTPFPPSSRPSGSSSSASSTSGRRT